MGRVEAALRALEATVRALRDEVRTRQLVVVDDEDRPRIVGEVFGEVAELRLELPMFDERPGSELLLFAVANERPGPVDLGPAVGLQLRAQGNSVFELDAWPDADGVWRTHVHLGGS